MLSNILALTLATLAFTVRADPDPDMEDFPALSAINATCQDNCAAYVNFHPCVASRNTTGQEICRQTCSDSALQKQIESCFICIGSWETQDSPDDNDDDDDDDDKDPDHEDARDGWKEFAEYCELAVSTKIDEMPRTSDAAGAGSVAGPAATGSSTGMMASATSAASGAASAVSGAAAGATSAAAGAGSGAGRAGVAGGVVVGAVAAALML